MSREVMQQSLEALEWFVKNDDTVIGMKGNEFWEAGLNRGIDTVAVLRKELAKPDHIPDAGKMVGPEPEHPLHVKAERESAWQARDTRCGCDHNEYCKKCWPLEFRAGGYWDQREAQAEHNTKEQA